MGFGLMRNEKLGNVSAVRCLLKVAVVKGVLLFALLPSCNQSEDKVETELEALGYEVSVAGFHRAAGLGEVEAMKVMVEKGVDPLAEIGGETALHFAAKKGQEEAVAFLLKQDVPVGLVGKEGRTPLMYAAEADEVGVIEMLLESGADPGARDEQGYRAITLAAEVGASEAVTALASRSREYLDDALLLASLRGQASTAEVLLNRGASIYARLDDGKTALMLASREGHDEVTRTLLHHGANRYALDYEGMTAGQIAIAAGHLEIGQVLLEEPGEEELTLPELPELADVEMLEMNVAGEDELSLIHISEPTRQY